MWKMVLLVTLAAMLFISPGYGQSLLWQSYMDKAKLERETGHPEEALKLYTAALVEAQNLPDDKKLETMNNIKELLIQQNQYAEASDMLLRMSGLMEKQPDYHPDDLTHLVVQLGDMSRLQKDYVRAESYYRLALSREERKEPSNTLTYVMGKLAEVLKASGKQMEAAALLEKRQEIGRGTAEEDKCWKENSKEFKQMRKYVQRKVEPRVAHAWRPPKLRGPLSATVTFRLSPKGLIQNVKLYKSSGSEVFDQNILNTLNGIKFPKPPAFSCSLSPRIRYVFDYGTEKR